MFHETQIVQFNYILLVCCFLQQVLSQSSFTEIQMQTRNVSDEEKIPEMMRKKPCEEPDLK